MSDQKKKAFSFKIDQPIVLNTKLNRDSNQSINHTDFLSLSDKEHKHNQSTREWLKISISSISAVITGIMLGLAILSLMKTTSIQHEHVKTNKSDVAKINNNGEQFKQGSVQNLNSFVLQGGIFQERKNAYQALDNMHKNGAKHANVFESQNGYYHILLGVYAEKSSAEFNVKKLKLSSNDVIVKQFTWPGSKEVQKQESENRGLVKLNLARNVVYHLLNKSRFEELQTAHLAWTNYIYHSSDKKAQWDEINNILNSAYMTFKEQRTRPHESHQLELSSSLLNYLILENKILSSIK